MGEYTDNPNTTYQDDICATLGRTTNRASQSKLLDMLLDENKVPGIDIERIAAGLTNRAESSELLWSWTKTNWDAVLGRLSSGGPMRSFFIKTVTTGLIKRELYEEVQQFFKEKNAKAGLLTNFFICSKG